MSNTCTCPEYERMNVNIPPGARGAALESALRRWRARYESEGWEFVERSKGSLWFRRRLVLDENHRCSMRGEG